MFNTKAYENAKLLITKLKTAKLNLDQLTAELRATKQNTQLSEEASNKERLFINQSIYEAFANYYDTHFYSQKTWYQKLFSWFGFMDAKEKLFLAELNAVKEDVDNYRKNGENRWSDWWLIAWVAKSHGVPRGNPKEYLHSNNTQLNNKRKLNLVTHRLMGSEDYSAYPEFQGSLPELAAYKLKRELEKFRDEFTWTDSQQRQLQHVITTMGITLEIMKLTALHRYLTAVQENDAQAQERIKDIQWEVYKLLYETPQHYSLVLPHGYMSETTAHAALVELMNNPNAKYRVNFFNSGAGALDHIQNISIWKPLDALSKLNQIYHAGVNNKASLLYLKQKTFEAIQKEQLVEKILAPTINSFKSPQEAHQAMSSLIVDYDKNKELHVDNKKYSLQTNGTCTHSCWDIWLSHNLDAGMLGAFQLFVNQRAQTKLAKIRAVYQPNTHDAEGMRKLASDGVKLKGTIDTTLTETLRAHEKEIKKDRDALATTKEHNSPTFFARRERVENHDKLVAVHQALRQPAMMG